MSYRKWPRDIKASKAAFDTFFTGCGGVLYPPNSLHALVTEETLFTDICPHGDDIWFWGMALLNNTRIRVVDDSKFQLNFVENTQDTALWRENDVGGRNDVMIRNMLERFPEIRQRLVVVEPAMV